MEIIFQLDKINECSPENRRGLSFELNYDPEATQQQVALSNNRWRFAREDRDYIVKNASAFKGMKFDLLLKNNGQPDQLLENYLDFTQDFLKSKNECVATSVRYHSMYWFNEASSAITFEYLYNNIACRRLQFIIKCIASHRHLIIIANIRFIGNCFLPIVFKVFCLFF